MPSRHRRASRVLLCVDRQSHSLAWWPRRAENAPPTARMSDGTANPEIPARKRRRFGVFIRLPLILLGVAIFMRISGCAEKLFYVPTRELTPAPAEFAGARMVRFESRDGTALCGWLLPSEVHFGAKAPTVLHVHGNAGSMNSHLWFIEYLPSAGFNVFLFDYRGYGESEGSAWRRGDLIADAEAALDAVLAQPEVDPARVGMYGQSLGGAIGLNVMAKRTEIRAAVLESPFASWRLAAATALGGNDPGSISKFLAWLLIDDGNRPEDAIRNIDRSILIIHGDADRIVPIEHSRLLEAAAGYTVRLEELSGGDHNSLRQSHPEVERMVIEFFGQRLN